MKAESRQLFNKMLNQIAKLNGVSIDDVTKNFSVAPSVQQILENRIQLSSAFLERINMIGVDDLRGDKLGLGLTGTIAGRTKVTQTNPRRPREMHDINDRGYECAETEFDTAMKWAQIDMWAKFPDFQSRVRDQIVRQQALDRIMIGFNGTHVAQQTDRDAFPLLQDVNKGWLQHYREESPSRVMSKGKAVDATTVKVGNADGCEYKNLDALVFDAKAILIDPTLKDHPDLVAIVSSDLLHDKYFPIINKDYGPRDSIAANDIVESAKRLGGLPAVAVPFFPANTIMVTPLSNLSIYYQNGSRRRHLREEPDYKQVANYESVNEAYVVERYEAGCLIENIELLP